MHGYGAALETPLGTAKLLAVVHRRVGDHRGWECLGKVGLRKVVVVPVARGCKVNLTES